MQLVLTGTHEAKGAAEEVKLLANAVQKHLEACSLGTPAARGQRTRFPRALYGEEEGEDGPYGIARTRPSAFFAPSSRGRWRLRPSSFCHCATRPRIAAGEKIFSRMRSGAAQRALARRAIGVATLTHWAVVEGHIRHGKPSRSVPRVCRLVVSRLLFARHSPLRAERGNAHSLGGCRGSHPPWKTVS